ncbi:hypothetical protein [Myxacorys almedinensis]|uniref:Uncharacterized protein n=1 Tax=Myxacorys almedinensis A TaxID=2690445 RepID=A0A8J7Z6K5_9CYAN|nr:hypothetical protein [Myxacorys almedinensis]NDJ17368.1 hypothetical protein [Myxacorys almedinensis A]
MNLFSTDELTVLTTESETTCVSIYSPMERLGVETQQNPIRFKNLIRQAEERLIAGGLRGQAARDLLEPALQLDNYEFWQHQQTGLAIFLSPNLFRYYRLPIDVPELVVVNDAKNDTEGGALCNRFHVKPLLPLLSGDGQFYILALSQNQIRLFQGTRFSVGEIELEDMPTSMAEALRFDDPEKSLQFHTGTPPSGSGGSRAAIFHGQGAGEDDQNENLIRYFRQVNDGLQTFLKNQRSPLILAGVEYLFPLYRQANTYSYVLEDGIPGNPETLTAEELQQSAWAIVQPYFEQTQQEVISQYEALTETTGQTASEVQTVVSAAYYHQVEALFVPVGQQQWGRFNPETGEVKMHSASEPGNEDLLDFAALHTLLNGGTVYAVEPDKVPGNKPIAAVLRY